MLISQEVTGLIKIESASSELLHLSSEIGPCLEEHRQQTEKQLPNIQKLVEDKKSAADILEEFTHPCGGSGWKLAVYRDFRDPDTPCPPEWQQTMYSERPYTCGKKTDIFCDFAFFPETANLEYSKVCGRIKGRIKAWILELQMELYLVALQFDSVVYTFGHLVLEEPNPK